MKNEKIKAIMFDYDGTLIDREYNMSDYTIKALHALKEKGYILAVNSGRPVKVSQPVTEKFLGEDFFEYVYGNNGSEYLNRKTGKIELIKYFTPKQIYEIAKIFDKDYIYLGVYDFSEKRYLFGNKDFDNQELKLWLEARNMTFKVVDYKTDFTKNYSKVLCLHKAEDYKITLDFTNSLNSEIFDAYPSSEWASEIVPKGTSKGFAVDDFAKLLGIKNENIMCFGDSFNDVEMLNNSFGVIMENADEELKKQYKEVAHNINELGIFGYLKENNYI